MQLLYLQALQLNSVANDISQHPYLTILVISLLFSGLLGAVKLWLNLFEKRLVEKFVTLESKDKEQAESISLRFEKMEIREDKQDLRLERIEAELRNYDKHVAVGVRESSEIHSAVARTEMALNAHVEKEEGTTWTKIDNLVSAVTDLKVSNEIAHAGLVAGQTVLTTRVEAMENKMPNGELEKLAIAYHDLARRRTDLPGKKRTVKKQLKKR